jgi:hypothetical protein
MYFNFKKVSALEGQMRLDKWLDKLIAENPQVQNFKDFIEKLKRHWELSKMTTKEVALLLEDILRRHHEINVNYQELADLRKEDQNNIE